MLKMNFTKNKRKWKIIGISAIFLIFLFFLITSQLNNQIIKIYNNKNSSVFYDRNGEKISILPNSSGYFSSYIDDIPSRFKELLLKKEDKYFYYHFGFNPISISEAAFGRIGVSDRRASSTITQQLAKILLGKERERNIKNKIIEAFYALSLEIFNSKKEILKMYSNSIYLGNSIQGINEASYSYFNIPPNILTDGQILQLLSTIQSPAENNPLSYENENNAILLAERFKLSKDNLFTDSASETEKNIDNYFHFSGSFFEINNFIKNSNGNQLTIDNQLTKKIRELLKRNIGELNPKNVKNGAVVIIKLPENELLTLIGSPDPGINAEGYQINMAEKPRPIGSTIKPFIYLKAFQKGLRPYTLVVDKEYKYITVLGFPLYPKNFDYKYRGEVSLHYALSNSLNVPSVKVLEYIGLDNFYSFLQDDLKFKPIQSLNQYQLGIALGALEMSIYDLARYFTVFPNNGNLKELKIFKNDEQKEKQISEPQYIQLINKILNDRKTGVEQFGAKSNLNLNQDNYALKTGTSHDFKDSWIVGYTPDFLVAVWVGNHDNSNMDAVSGQLGAGKIWSEIMQILINSEYNNKTAFSFSFIKEIRKENNIEYGLADDDYNDALYALCQKEQNIIMLPHEGDAFFLENETEIILKSNEIAKWHANEIFIDEGKEVFFYPDKSGLYIIKAKTKDKEEKINIFVND